MQWKMGRTCRLLMTGDDELYVAFAQALHKIEISSPAPDKARAFGTAAEGQAYVPLNPISKRIVAVVLHLEPQTHRERPARHHTVPA